MLCQELYVHDFVFHGLGIGQRAGKEKELSALPESLTGIVLFFILFFKGKYTFWDCSEHP